MEVEVRVPVSAKAQRQQSRVAKPAWLESGEKLPTIMSSQRCIGAKSYRKTGNKIFVADEPAWHQTKDDWARSLSARVGQPEAQVVSTKPEPCPICMDDDIEGLLELECGHVAHRACLEAMISAKWTGKRITFNYMNCFMCRQQLKHPELENILAPHVDLRRKVTSVCLSACKKDDLIDNLDRLVEESPEQAEAAAMAEVACFECGTCGEPYAAGRVDCGVEEGIDVSKLKCAGCHWKTPNENKCTKHGADDAVIKCDWCCNIAMFKCGAGMFCAECHQPPYAHTQPLHDPNSAEKRKVGQGQRCPGPDKCPLGKPHPPNGTAHRAFVIGCLHGCC
jgi:E3 ubiquitin-protein ligase MYCBP2